jgi:peroxiredoxin
LQDLKTLGANLVAISPELPERALSTAEQHSLGFEVLSDVGNTVARKFGLVFTLAQRLRPIYQGFGIDIPASNGDDSFELPIPATFAIREDGTIILAFVDADYTKRMEPADVIAALKNC